MGKKTPIHAISMWVRRQPRKIKAFLAVLAAMTTLVFLRMVVHDHDSLFVIAEAVHAIGISVLLYKLMKERTCTGTKPSFLFIFYSIEMMSSAFTIFNVNFLHCVLNVNMQWFIFSQIWSFIWICLTDTI